MSLRTARLPELLTWSASTACCQRRRFEPSPIWASSVSRSERSTVGQGGSQMDLVLMGLALGYHSQSVAITPGAAASLGIKPLQLCGSEDQKRAHLPDLAAGKRMFVFGLSEPGRGSDAANPEVRATRIAGVGACRGKMLVHECQVGQSYYSACDDQPRGTPRTSLYLLYRTHGRSACTLPGDARQAGVDAVLHRRDCAGSGRSAGQRPPGCGTRGVSASWR